MSDFFSGLQPFDFFVASAFLASLGLTLRYACYSPWWETRTGQSFMSLVMSLTVVLGMIATARFVGEYPGRDVVRLFVYSALTAALIWVQVQVWREQKRGGFRVVQDRRKH